MVFHKARTRMKERTDTASQAESASETNKRARPALPPVLPGGRWARSGQEAPQASPPECPIRAGRPGPTLDYCLTAVGRRKVGGTEHKGWPDSEKLRDKEWTSNSSHPAPILCHVPAS